MALMPPLGQTLSSRVKTTSLDARSNKPPQAPHQKTEALLHGNTIEVEVTSGAARGSAVLIR